MPRLATPIAEGAPAPVTKSSEVLLPGNKGIVHVAGNELALYDSSGPLIAAMEQDIRRASARVWLETYILADDTAGQAIAAALKDRARAGLDVRVMYDAIGSYATPARFFDELTEAGVQVHAYRTLREAWRLGSARGLWNVLRLLNRRNHRKLTIIDDAIAYFGGMNIVDQSGLKTVEDVKATSLPTSAGWRDVHVRAEGPINAEAAAAFERLWRRVHQMPVRRWPPVSVLPQLRNPDESVACYDLRPSLRDGRAGRVFIPLIRAATRTITVSVAYFVPVGGVVRELIRAHRRGVKVRIIVPSKCDVPVVQCAQRHLHSWLISKGLRIFERKDLMLHSKVMLIDDEWTIVGSCNLDPRSFRLNLEFLSVVRSRAMNKAAGRIIRHDLRNSRRVRLADCRRRWWWQRLADRMAWSFRNLL